MAGWGAKVGDVVVPFDDMTTEAWGRVNRYANTLVGEVDAEGNESRLTWLEFYAWPMRDPNAARIIHEEAVKVAEPTVDAAAMSLQLYPGVMALNGAFVEVEDDLPVMKDGRPTEGEDPK